MKLHLIAASAVAAVMGLSAASMAASIDLSDAASRSTIFYGGGESRYGAVDLRRNVGAVSGNMDHLADLVTQSYYLRYGGNTINLAESASLAFSNANTATLAYNDGTISATIKYTLLGSANGVLQNVLNRQVTVRNLTGAAISNVSLFSYTDLTLNGILNDPANSSWQNPGDAYVDITPQEFARIQTVDGKVRASQSDVDGVGRMLVTHSETVPLGPANHNAGRPNRVEIAAISAAAGSSLLSKITGGQNLATDVTSSTDISLGQPGVDSNIEYAMQWDFVLAAQGQGGSSFSVTEATQIIPEPASLALLGLGAALVVAPRRRRQA